MQTITKKILYSSGSTEYNIDILLTEDFKLQGIYDELENTNSNLSNNNIIFITGYTESMLDEIQGYDQENPYKVGINGVIEVKRNPTTLKYTEVKYNINDIIYTTNLTNNTTYYIYTGTTSNNYNDNFLYKKDDLLLNINETPRINNYINVERQEYSVLDKVIKINRAINLQDIDDLE
jgi:hypothetical protein